MRKKLLLLLIMIFLGKTALAAPVPTDMARQVAVNWMNENTGRGLTVDDSALSPESPDKCHVITFGCGGWVIISGNDLARPVIGYSPDGSYGGEDDPPAFRHWMENPGKSIAEAKRKRRASSADVRKSWRHLAVPPEEFAPAYSGTRRASKRSSKKGR